MSARDPKQTAAKKIPDRVVVFHLQGTRYALPLECVQEIQQIVAFSEVPGGSNGLLGLLNLRGEVIPAVDLREALGMEVTQRTLETPMVIARVDDSSLVALVVDGVEDVLDLPADCLQEPPAMHTLSAKLLGVCHLEDGLVFLFDIEALLADVMLPTRR